MHKTRDVVEHTLATIWIISCVATAINMIAGALR